MDKIIKKKRAMLMLDFNRLSSQEIIRTLSEIRVLLQHIFKNHIGKENYITAYELFNQIYNILPENIDVYKRTYLYNIIKMVIRMFRRTGELFIINRNSILYVLKTKEELKSFNKETNNHIKILKEIKIKAQEWVEGEKWKNL